MNKKQTEQINRLSQGYTIMPNSVKLNMMHDFDLSFLELFIFEYVIMISKTNMETSRKMIADVIGSSRAHVSDAFKKLKKLNLISEEIVSVKSIFHANIPLKYLSIHSTDSVAGKKNITNRDLLFKTVFLKPVSLGYTLKNKPVSLQYRVKINLYCSDTPRDDKVNLKKSEFKEKVKAKPQPSFSFKSKEEIRIELRTRYNCTDQDLDIAFSHQESKGITTVENFFHKNIQADRFKVMLDVANREACLSAEARHRETYDHTPTDIKGAIAKAQKDSREARESIKELDIKAKSGKILEHNTSNVADNKKVSQSLAALMAQLVDAA